MSTSHAGRVGHDQACGQRVCLQGFYVPSALLQPDAHDGRDVLHRIWVLGCDIEVLAEPVDQAMGLDRVAAGERERVGAAYGEHVCKQAVVQAREVHAVVRALSASSPKALSQTSRTSRLTSVRRVGHRPTRRSWSRYWTRSSSPALGQDDAVVAHPQPGPVEVERGQP